MSYCTQQQLTERFGERELIQLTNFDANDTINTDTLDRAITATAAEIDSYLVDRYTTPLAGAPERIVDIAADLVRCRLYTHDIPDNVAEACKQARRWLEGVAMGKWSVPGLAEKSGAETTGSPQVHGPSRVFTSDSLKDF